MGYKVGRYTTGIALIGLGILFLLHQFTDRDWLKLALTLWPFILIGYGVEYLLVTRKELRFRFDMGGALLLIVVYIGIFIYAYFSLVFTQIVNPKYAVQGEPITLAADEVQRMRISSAFGSVSIEASDDPQIRIIPTYRSNRSLSLDEMMNKVDFQVAKDGSVVNIRNEMKSRPPFVHVFQAPVSLDLKIFAPKDLATKIEHAFGLVEIKNMERIESVELDFGVVILDHVQNNVALEVNFGYVDVDGLVGGLQANVDFGRVEVEGEVFGTWDVETNFGAVKLVIPTTSNIAYTFDVDLGTRVLPNPPFVNKDSGIINDGTYPLRAEVDFGLIEVELRH